MEKLMNPDRVRGLDKDDALKLRKLIDTLKHYEPKNREKDKYYEGKVTLGDVNLGIALPEGMQGLEIGCAWGAKTVDVLAGRSMFDGYVNSNGMEDEELSAIVRDNSLIA